MAKLENKQILSYTQFQELLVTHPKLLHKINALMDTFEHSKQSENKVKDTHWSPI